MSRHSVRSRRCGDRPRIRVQSRAPSRTVAEALPLHPVASDASRPTRTQLVEAADRSRDRAGVRATRVPRRAADGGADASSTRRLDGGATRGCRRSRSTTRSCVTSAIRGQRPRARSPTGVVDAALRTLRRSSRAAPQRRIECATQRRRSQVVATPASDRQVCRRGRDIATLPRARRGTGTRDTTGRTRAALAGQTPASDSPTELDRRRARRGAFVESTLVRRSRAQSPRSASIGPLQRRRRSSRARHDRCCARRGSWSTATISLPERTATEHGSAEARARSR